MIWNFLNLFSVCFLLACAFVFFSYYRESTYSFWKKLNIKYLTPFPVFGNTVNHVLYLCAFHETLDQIYKAFLDEPYGGFYQMRDPVLMVKDPRLVSTILVKDFKHFHDRNPYPFSGRNRKLDPLSFHFVLAKGERWRILRQKMSPAFSSAKSKIMFEQIHHCVNLLIEYIDKQMDNTGSLNVAMKPLVERLTIDLIGSCAFGIECDSLNSNEKFVQICREISRPRLANTIRIIISIFSSRLLKMLKIPATKKEVTDFFLNLILDTVDYRRRNKVVRNDLLQLLMELQNCHVDPKFSVNVDNNKKILANENFDEIDIAANSFMFFISGFETTSSTISFCLYELALNANIQQKLRLEVQQMKNKYKTINYDSLSQMTFMDAIIAETLRKYPPAPAINRASNEDYIIPETNIKIPAGTKIIIPVWSIQHDWKNYSNPEVFDPERFIANDMLMRPSGVYLPFGNGPRSCIGQRFAELQMKITISEIILKYNLRPCDKTEIPLRFKKGTIFLQTKCGTWVNLCERQI